MVDLKNQGAPGKGPALDVGNTMQHTTKRNPGRSAGKGPALEIGQDVKFATNDDGTGVLADQPLGPHRYEFLPPVVDPSGTSSNPETNGAHVTGGVAPRK